MPVPVPVPFRGIRPREHMHPLIWCISIIVGLILIVVVIAGAVVLIGYLAIKPTLPRISVYRANLDALYVYQPDVLTVQITVVVRAVNDNDKSFASVYDPSLALSFQGKKLGYLLAPTSSFDVKANQTVEINYLQQSFSVRLASEQLRSVNLSFRKGEIDFQLQGTTRARWRVWRLSSVKYLLNVDCKLRLPIDMSTIYPRRCRFRS